MKRVVDRIVQLLLILVLAGSIGCGQPPKPKKFNNLIARANERMSGAAKNFYKAITTRPAAMSDARSAYTEMEAALRDARRDFDAMSAPMNSGPGQVMLDKYRAYLSAQQTIMDRCIGPIWAEAQKPDADWGRINKLVQQAQQEAAKPFQELGKAHQDFCKHHNFEAKAR